MLKKVILLLVLKSGWTLAAPETEYKLTEEKKAASQKHKGASEYQPTLHKQEKPLNELHTLDITQPAEPTHYYVKQKIPSLWFIEPKLTLADGPTGGSKGARKSLLLLGAGASIEAYEGALSAGFSLSNQDGVFFDFAKHFLLNQSGRENAWYWSLLFSHSSNPEQSFASFVNLDGYFIGLGLRGKNLSWLPDHFVIEPQAFINTRGLAYRLAIGYQIPL